MVGAKRRHRHPKLGRLAGVLLRTQPDERLAALTREGGEAPFEEIVRRHRPALNAFAGSLAPASRAEDVVQESLLKAYAALREGAEPELLRAWLFRIVRNTAIDEQRGVRHHEQLDESYDGVEQPPQALDRREQLASLIAAIADLPAAQREAIVKRELEGRGHAEIARDLTLSPGAVRQLIYRARHTLRAGAGAIVPAALLRAASLPGADEAVGGVGMAGALKLGLAAIVATGTIVAGTSIEERDRSATAEALQLHDPSKGPRADASQSGFHDPRAGEDGGGDDSRRSSNSGPGSRGDRDSSGHSEEADGSSGSDGHSGSGESGAGDSGSSGSGSSGSGDSGSGSSGSDGGGDILSTTSGEGSFSSGSGSGDALEAVDGITSGSGSG